MKKFLWVEQYRPQKIDDCILPDNLKKPFQGFVEQGEIPNLLLLGSAGVGKTTVAKALCEEIGASYIVINGSDEGRFIDTVRNRVKTFASTSLWSVGHPKRSLSSTRQTTPLMTCNSPYVPLWRSFTATADSSLPVTSRTRSSNRCTHDAQSLTFVSLRHSSRNCKRSSLVV